MNTYYAVVNDGFIQYNMRDGCLQVFEDKQFAETEISKYGGELTQVSVLKHETATELLEALEGLLRKFGDFENDPNSRGIGWNPEMIEALHDAESAIAKAKS